MKRNKRALDKESYRRQRAVMLTARALASEETDRDNAKAFALEAAKLAPTLVPAAALAGRMLAEGGELRRAARVINKAWQANPHPDLAQVFADLRFGDAARDRLKRIEALAKKASGHIEGALALARAAIDAREYGKARAALAPYLAAPTRRVALLMAELERAEPTTKAAPANGSRVRSMPRPIRPGPPMGMFPTAGCRFRQAAGSMLSNGAFR